MADPNAMGIYAIINTESNKIYVGSTACSFKKRWSEHRASLRGGYHRNGHLQHSWDKYSENAFEFIVLEYVDDLNILIGREQHWLDAIKMICEVYNKGPVAVSPWLGMLHSEETRSKISEAMKGERHPFYGKHLSEETRRKMSEAHKSERLSEETRCKMSEAHKGKHHSEKTRHKISEALKSGNVNAKPYPSFVHEETDEIIPAGVNLSALCRERGLNIRSMCAVMHSQQLRHKDWMLHTADTSLRIG